jgi:FSR family fosmidomycin resistance protein-like MFS transporter
MEGKAGSRAGSILSYGLVVMTLTHTLTHVFGRLYTASFPIIRDEFGLSIQQLGILAAIPPLCQALLSIPSGVLTDRIGSKRMLLASLAFAVLGSLLAATASSPATLIVAASLVYLNTTIYHPASYSFTTRLFERSDRPKALGIHGAGGTFGVALGPLTLSVFLGLLGLTWRHVYLFWAAPLFLGAVLVLRLRGAESYNDAVVEGSSTEPGETGPNSLLTRGLLMFLLFTAVRTIAGQMIATFMPLFIVDVKGFTVEQMGAVVSSRSLTGLLAAPLGGFLAARFGSKRWLSVSIVMSLVMLSLVTVVPGGIPFIAVYMIYGFVGTLGMAARSALIANLTPSSRRGVGYALLFLPGSVVGAIAPVVAASLIELYGFSRLFPASILISLLGLIILLVGIKETEG